MNNRKIKLILSIVFAVLAMFYIPHYTNQNFNEEDGLSAFGQIFYLNFFLIFLFVFNFTVRRKAKFKSYFTSRFNIICGKYRAEKVFDFNSEILADKLEEVLIECGYKNIKLSDNKLELFATASTTFWSWGENIYIDLIPVENDQTRLSFCSVAVIGFISFDKNGRNFDKLVDTFNEALII